MSAKGADIKRVRELYAVIQETKERLAHLNLTKEDFLSDETVGGRLAADGLLMCVFRATEEAGAMSQETREAYPSIYWAGIKSMRNILAHDYGAADREAIWDSIECDFPELEEFCIAYCEDHGESVEG